MDSARVCGAVLLAWVVTFVPASVRADGCEACHSDPAFCVRDRRLCDYYQDWLTSPHKQAGVTCSQCHDGDPAAQDKDAAHAGRLPVIDPNSTVYFKKQPETCGRCHREVAEQFTGSRHYSKVLSDELAPTCTTCHRAMNRKPYFRSILRGTCDYCHAPGQGPRRGDVVDDAVEILHRLNVSRVLLGWTALHFSREGWPGDSKRHVEALRQAYHAALARGHSLDLLAVDQASVELLVALQRIFNERRAWPPTRAGGR